MIITFVGQQGEGKTITMVMFMHMIAKDYNMPISSNFNIIGNEKPLITSWTSLLNRKGHVIGLDEAHHSVDSRNYKNNVQISQILSQIRKLRIVLLYTTQQFRKVDLRLRNETNFMIRTRHLGGSHFNLLVYDLKDQEFGLMTLVKSVHVDCRDYFRLYDTYEIIGAMSV